MVKAGEKVVNLTIKGHGDSTVIQDRNGQAFLEIKNGQLTLYPTTDKNQKEGGGGVSVGPQLKMVTDKNTQITFARM